MNKKGFYLLPESTLKMIIAVIVLVLLGVFLIKLYFSYTEDKEFKQAEAALTRLSPEISSMSIGEEKEFEIFSPISKTFDIRRDYWVFLAWTKSDENFPIQCSTKGWDNCICICLKDSDYLWHSLSGKTFEKCDKIGTCTEINQFAVIDNIVTGPGFGFGYIPLVLGEIKNPPIILKISKTKEGIKITEN